MSPNTSLSSTQLFKAICAVALGGALGTLVRDLLLRTNWLNFSPSNTARVGYYVPIASSTWVHEIPWMLLIINFVGVVIATYALHEPMRNLDPNNLTRLVVITGFFGGFTSYSGLFVDIAAVWHKSAAGGLVVCFGAVLSGVLAAWLGLKVRVR